jgi:hypothetical protein
MYGFRIAPRIRHLKQLQQIYGYLSKMRFVTIRVRIDEPDFSDIPDPEYDWAYTVYSKTKELLPKDAPVPLGKYVTLSHYVDANLMHNIISGKSVTGILHLVNKTPTEWYSKKQATVETMTYGSKFVAARVLILYIVNLHQLRYQLLYQLNLHP